MVSLFWLVCSTERGHILLWHVIYVNLSARDAGQRVHSFHAQSVCGTLCSESRTRGWPVSQNKFLKGASMPTWDLSIVLRALRGSSFEPLQSADLRPLSFKTTLLLALASVKRVGDLQTLSVSASWLDFGPKDCSHPQTKTLLCSKVLSTPFRAQVITLLALPNTSFTLPCLGT